MTSPSFPLRSRHWRLLTIALVLAIAAVSVLPNYITGNWAWNTPPGLPQTSQLNQVKEQGMSLPGWTTLDQTTREIGGHTWSMQAIAPDADTVPSDLSADEREAIAERPVLLMMRPQTWHRDQPQVEWMDINGTQDWVTDRHRRLRMMFVPELAVNAANPPAASAPDSETDAESGDRLSTATGSRATAGIATPGDRPVSITARYFRGWNRQQTYAVMQWYAWPTGGSPTVSDWFWTDQRVQWRDRQRLPWVAVNVFIPIEPLGDIDAVQPLAEALGQTIQTALIHDVFVNPT